MSKKNTIVLNHKNCFTISKQISELYLDFKKKILNLRSKNFIVAVSGGPDSLALSAMCKIFELNNKNKKFHYIHINHGIRKNSSTEAKLVKKILAKQQITLLILNNKKKIINNFQNNARKIRYSLLSQESKKRKAKLILTAHHKDDQIETFLIRLSRGSGVQGLSAMNTISYLENKIKIFRPFLTTSKSDLISISKKIFGTFIKDPSNQNTKYLRTNIRKLLPLFKKYGIREDQIIKSINNLKSSSETINIYFKDIFKKIVKKRNNNYFIEKKDLFSLNVELQLRILGSVIKQINKSYYPPRSKKLETALNFLKSSQGKQYQLGGCWLKDRSNGINIQKA